MKLRNVWRVLKKQRRPVKFIAGRLLRTSGLSKFMVIQQADHRLRFYPATMCEQRWLDPKSPVRPVENFIRRYLKPGDTFVDVGANVGVFSMVGAAVVGEQGRVYAVEPHPRIFEYLEGHVKLNCFENVRTVNAALGATEGTVRLSDMRADDENKVVDNGSGIEVPLKTLDGLGIMSDEVALLKVDVEGYEQQVFDGGRQLMPRARCVVYESGSDQEDRADSSHQLIAFLRKEGFEVYRIVDNNVAPVPEDYRSATGENLVALRDLQDFLARTRYRPNEIPDELPSLHPYHQCE